MPQFLESTQHRKPFYEEEFCNSCGEKPIDHKVGIFQLVSFIVPMGLKG